MADHTLPEHDQQLSLRERLPDYLAFFGAGLAASAAMGVFVVLVSNNGFMAGFGYSMIGLGTLMLLAGGVSGGGYANLGAGALGTMFGSSLRHQPGSAEDDDPEELRKELFGHRGDPRERLRKGLRPEANPRAFWQVIGGIAYFAIGTTVVINWPG